MLRLRDKIESLTSNLAQDVTFNYARRSQQNADAHQQPLTEKPTICMVEIESGVFSLNPNLGSFKEKYPTVAIQFLALSKFEYNSKENDEIVDQMKELAKEFLLRYDESDFFDALTEVPFFQLFHTYDEECAGVEITLNVVEKNSQGVCLNHI